MEISSARLPPSKEETPALDLKETPQMGSKNASAMETSENLEGIHQAEQESVMEETVTTRKIKPIPSSRLRKPNKGGRRSWEI